MEELYRDSKAEVQVFVEKDHEFPDYGMGFASVQCLDTFTENVIEIKLGTGTRDSNLGIGEFTPKITFFVEVDEAKYLVDQLRRALVQAQTNPPGESFMSDIDVLESEERGASIPAES